MVSDAGKTALFVLIALGLVGLVSGLAVRGGRDQPVTVTTTHAVRQNLSSWITSNGKVEPIEPRIIQAPLTTFIETIAVREGQTANRGQILMTLDAKDVRSDLAHMREEIAAAEDERRTALGGGSPDEVAQLKSDLAKTNSEIDRLHRERESLERLYAKQAATRREIEDTKTALEKAEADKRLIEEKKSAITQRSKLQAERAALRIDTAQNSIRSLQEKLNSAQVAAPVSGTLYSLPARAGTYVHTGDLLAELADLKHIRVRVFVDEPELGSLKEGQSVEVTWEGQPNRTWTGRVEQLPKTVVARGSRNVGEVLCSVTNEQAELLPNTNVNARIRIGDRENSLTIPRAAVRTEGGAHYVFVADHGRLQKREVNVGISNPTDYELLSGITERDVIAMPGVSELQQGMAVTIAEQ
ncbi:MAG TPA: efflux RND transporter periplasmic adaptor subunit [Terriglobia bacterium]|nr:efflux RND transporter periplasmic adaptor subunit [Terriglobia bacterium]